MKFVFQSVSQSLRKLNDVQLKKLHEDSPELVDTYLHMRRAMKMVINGQDMERYFFDTYAVSGSIEEGYVEKRAKTEYMADQDVWYEIWDSNLKSPNYKVIELESGLKLVILSVGSHKVSDTIYEIYAYVNWQNKSEPITFQYEIHDEEYVLASNIAHPEGILRTVIEYLFEFNEFVEVKDVIAEDRRATVSSVKLPNRGKKKKISSIPYKVLYLKRPIVDNPSPKTNDGTRDPRHPDCHWSVRGHWRRIKGIGHDKEGELITGLTWVREHKSGDLTKPYKEKIVIVRNKLPSGFVEIKNDGKDEKKG